MNAKTVKGTQTVKAYQVTFSDGYSDTLFSSYRIRPGMLIAHNKHGHVVESIEQQQIEFNY